MADGVKNFAASTVLTAPTPALSGLSLVLASGGGGKMPAAPFNAMVYPTGQDPNGSNCEIVRVTAKATDTLTIVRAQEGTVARTIIAGDNFVAGITAKVIQDIYDSNFNVVANVIRVGPTDYSIADLAVDGGPQSAYIVVEKSNTPSDASFLIRDQGAIRVEIGAATDNRLHIKAVSGAAGSETFLDGLIMETTAKVWAPIAIGIGTIPAADFHIGFTRAGTRVIAKIENDGNGGATYELKTPAGDWGVVSDVAQNGGNNFGIQDFNAGYPPRLVIDSAGKVAIGTDTPTQQLDVRGKIAVGGTTGSPGTAGVQIIPGTGSPQGAVAAPVGSIFLRSDGGTSTTLYVKETGTTTSSGWVAK